MLIASDLPVRYFEHRAKTLQLQAAIRYVLAQRGYKAGKYAVGYQACDDSSPQQGSGALAKCAANAKAYAQDPSVVGLIGTWSSSCSAVELPILNRAAGGPSGPDQSEQHERRADARGGGTQPGEPARYYPTGTHSFVRIISPDDAQAVADALLVKDLGARRIFVLDDGEEYGLNVAERIPEVGLEDRPDGFAGRRRGAPIRPTSTIWSGVIRGTSPDAVFLGGFPCPDCGKLVAGLRAALPRSTIVGSDGFSDFEGLVKATGRRLRECT